jgi:hypothetical protein
MAAEAVEFRRRCGLFLMQHACFDGAVVLQR